MKTCHGSSPTNVLHVGAHTGEEAKSYFDNGAQTVVWFEANDALIPELTKHVSQFDLKQQIVPLALWDKNETLIFKITNNNQSSSFFDLDKHSSYYPEITVTTEKEVNAYRFDNIVYKENLLICNNFDFINIDTQGAELAILKGMGDYLNSSSLKGIYLEINREFLYKNIPLVSEIDDYLRKFNFVRLISKWTKDGWGDAIYIKQNEMLI